MATYNTKKHQLYYDKVVKLYQVKKFSVVDISKIIPVSRSTISRWISTFAPENINPSGIPMNNNNSKEQQVADHNINPQDNNDVDSLRKELSQLRRQLADAELKASIYDEMINVAEKQFSISIRKKAGTK